MFITETMEIEGRRLWRRKKWCDTDGMIEVEKDM